MTKARKPWMKVERRSVTEAEAELFNLGTGPRFWGSVQRAFEHNAAVLRRFGYPCNTHMGNIRPAAEIAEPEAQLAAEVVDAVGNVCRAWSGEDKAALADAALWLGIVSCPDIHLEHTRRDRERGGEARAANLKESNQNAWMEAIFDQAHAQLEADDRARIGRLELARVARKIASDPSHPDRARRSELTEAQARRYLDARKQPAK